MDETVVMRPLPSLSALMEFRVYSPNTFTFLFLLGSMSASTLDTKM